MSALPHVTTPATGTATVSVMLKLQMGFRLRLHRPITENEATAMGMKEMTRHVWTGDEWFVQGTSHLQTEGPRCIIIDGYAVTHGVPKDLWDRWLEENADLALVRNGLIKASKSHLDVELRAVASDGKALKTGLERLNPHKPMDLRKGFKQPRQGDGRALSAVAMADEQSAPIGEVDDQRY